jgi:transposase
MNVELEKRIKTMMPILNERQLRQYLGAEAESIGFGGIEQVAKISGKSRNTIVTGMKDNGKKEELGNRIRREGGGRKSIKSRVPEIIKEIESIVGSETYGNPEVPLSYTTKSLRKIQKYLNEKGHTIGYDVVGDLLKELGYSLQLNQKMIQVGNEHPERNKQFEYINQKSLEFLEANEPVISIDAKKKEMVGNFKNNGKTYNKQKSPTQVLDHDFPLKELGKVVPYGVYDIAKNEGFVNLGISKDTAEFAVESIARWWLTVGKNTYSEATKLYINCDGGGSNGVRVRLFKLQLQEFATQSGLEVHISHLPPGTSKWNKIEHKLFCYISSNWKGQPLISVEAIIKLISSTTTTKGLKVTCMRDDGKYEIGKKVSDEDYEKINIKREETCPDWNYIISPINS